jgi:hypothetical protein
MAGVRFPAGANIFSTASRTTLGPIQPPIKFVLWALSPVIKQPGREADDSPPTSVEVKSGGAVAPLPHKSSQRSASLMKHRYNFNFIMIKLHL